MMKPNSYLENKAYFDEMLEAEKSKSRNTLTEEQQKGFYEIIADL